MNVELVLRRDVAALGKAGQRVKVARGYARNYLIPKGLAYLVSADNLLRLEFEKRKLAKEAEAHRDRMKEKAKAFEGKSFTIMMKTTEEGHLYGSVDAQELVKAMAAEGFETDLKSVKLAEAIKETGIYEVTLQMHPEVECSVKFWVVDESGKIHEKKPEPEPEPEPEPAPAPEQEEKPRGRRGRQKRDN